MSKTLIFILAAIIVVGAILIYSMIRPKRKSKDNRYTRKSNHLEPTLGKNPLQAPENGFTMAAENEYVRPVVSKENSSQIFDEVDSDAALAVKPKQATQNIIMLYLMAPNGQPYNGYELLQALLSVGLRYGNMQIFHRYEQKTGRGDVLFSLASATKPGTFDLPKMGGFSCAGLALFLDINKVKDPRNAFDIMLETAGQLAEDLGGKVLDEQRQLLTKEKAVALIKMIRECQQEHKTADLFA